MDVIPNLWIVDGQLIHHEYTMIWQNGVCHS